LVNYVDYQVISTGQHVLFSMYFFVNNAIYITQANYETIIHGNILFYLAYSLIT